MSDGPGYGFRFAGEAMIACASGALYRPAHQMLVVADLHLGRSERYARRGGALLPPWESADTLGALEAELRALQPACLVSLGDSFDDLAAAEALAPDLSDRIAALSDLTRVIWIRGNHDQGALPPRLRGQQSDELPGAIALRHEPGEGPDISGHLHASVRLAGRRWRCFVRGAAHLILPAFGSYTGGLDLSDPIFARLAPGGLAIACAERPFALPLPHRRGAPR